MGCNTNLYLSTRWSINDVTDILERVYSTKVKVHIIDNIPNCLELWFNIKGHNREIFMHHVVNMPLGQARLLSLGHNDEAVGIMESIAGVLGGLIEDNDCEEKLRLIDGARRAWYYPDKE